MVKFH